MSRDKIDRRDFVTSTIAAVGTSAILASESDAAAPQENMETRNSETATVYTGETIQGKKVVSRLNVADLEPGRKHFLYFQGVQAPGGQHWYVSVAVAKGI